ncbi:hypothetical protein B9Z19DRAFT_1069088 [Tuber borchii]|uniref:Uncharacterized protein n=1 Tax=Tuber borchii TaxID=42251 RepID=A0A2T6ZCU8_TUBBO|nr:hypothetical protein B9Z19DRAFT_1069088 [Tuber borchii]
MAELNIIALETRTYHLRVHILFFGGSIPALIPGNDVETERYPVAFAGYSQCCDVFKKDDYCTRPNSDITQSTIAQPNSPSYYRGSTPSSVIGQPLPVPYRPENNLDTVKKEKRICYEDSFYELGKEYEVDLVNQHSFLKYSQGLLSYKGGVHPDLPLASRLWIRIAGVGTIFSRWDVS